MIRINLIRDRPAPVVTRRRWPRSWLFTPLAAVMVVAAHIVQGSTLTSLQEARDRLFIEVTARHAAREAQAAAARARPAVDPSPATGAALSARRLRDLAAAVPAELWVVGYRESDSGITIEGVARGDDAVQQLASELSGSEGFGDVEITETARDKSEPARCVFTLVARLQRAPDAGAPGVDAGAVGD